MDWKVWALIIGGAFIAWQNGVIQLPDGNYKRSTLVQFSSPKVSPSVEFALPRVRTNHQVTTRVRQHQFNRIVVRSSSTRWEPVRQGQNCLLYGTQRVATGKLIRLSNGWIRVVEACQ